MRIRPFATLMTLTMLLGLPAAALAALAETPAPAPTATYRKPVLAVMAVEGDPYASRLDWAVQGLKRFQHLSVPMPAHTNLPAFLAKAKAAAQAAGLGDAPVYALVPAVQFGSVSTSSPDREEKVEAGLIKSTVYSYLQCPFTFSVAIYDVKTGARVDLLQHQETLKRRYEYHYDQNHTDRAIAAKAEELSIQMTRDALIDPVRGFDSEASNQLLWLVPRLMLDLRNVAPFQLKAQVTGWDASRDSIFLNLGSEVDVHPGNGFTIRQHGREIGFVKVRKVEETRSEAVPIFLDGTLQVSDQLEERPKFNNWQGLKAGVSWMGGPAAIGTYGGEIDFGPYLGLNDWFGTGDVSLFTTQVFSGRMAEVGLVRKHFLRRWGLYYGLKIGGAEVDGLVGQARTFGGSLAAGLNCYITPDFVWVTDAALQAYTPLYQRGGPEDGKLVQPLGPMVRTGVSYIF